MIAIETRYLGPTNYRGSRYVATTCNGHRLVQGALASLDSEDNQEAVATRLAVRMGWLTDGGPVQRWRLVGGGTRRGMCWVFVPAGQGVSRG